ncbi:MFS domain-containing protein [Mycena venus]|uniref:MFS domain-containing protein n=1 Tax=Mycena venus TaxID=2733690 RepID=A0A8H7D0R0_9AGAR|nr:MFS domain-containing protein [Mycena venus]
MASRIPKRPRTLAPENQNARPTRAPGDAKVFGVAALKAAAASAAPTHPISAREGKTNTILEGSKRKRKAQSGSMTVQTTYSGMSTKNRKILGLPKQSTATTTAAAAQRAPLRPVAFVEQPQRPQVFVPPPVNATRTTDAAQVRLSNRQSLITFWQQQREQEVALAFDAEEEEPLAKRQRTSLIGPEDVPSEPSDAEIAADLDACTDDDAEEEELATDFYAGDWEDLDAADYNDPMMVSEYVADIQRYLKQVELTTLPSPTYMSRQPSLTWSARALLNDWLTQVHMRFNLLPETLFLCVHLIDRFLSLRAVSLEKLQLVGMTALLLAAKFEETYIPPIVSFTQMSYNAFSAEQMCLAEQYILRTLEWNLSYPSPIHWLRRVSKAEGYKLRTRQLGKYLAEIFIVEECLVATPPSLLAAAAIWLARLALGEGDWVSARATTSSMHDSSDSGAYGDRAAEAWTYPKDNEHYALWTPNLAHYATYTEHELLPAAGCMLRYVLQPIRHESFYRKWAGKQNMKVSVDLVAELPALKREFHELGRTRRERKATEARVRGGKGEALKRGIG